MAERPELHVHRADDVRGTATHFGAVTLHIDQPLPPGDASETFQADARTIADVLWATLPGATVDELLVVLMRRRASSLRVPFGPGTEEEGEGRG